MLLLALSGSLRLASYNGALLTAAQALVPEGVTLDIFGQLREIPPYGEDARIGGDPRRSPHCAKPSGAPMP